MHNGRPREELSLSAKSACAWTTSDVNRPRVLVTYRRLPPSPFLVRRRFFYVGRCVQVRQVWRGCGRGESLPMAQSRPLLGQVCTAVTLGWNRSYRSIRPLAYETCTWYRCYEGSVGRPTSLYIELYRALYL